MADVLHLEAVATHELVEELTRRGALPRCPCRRWGTFVGVYDVDGHTLRCRGCLRAVCRCTCA